VLTEGQQQALRELQAIVAAKPGAVELLDYQESGGELIASIALDCRGWERRPSGLPLRSRERFQVHVPGAFPFRPPSVDVPHLRWRKSSHVQWGRQLCVYRSVETEWNPSDGMFGFIDPRLTSWLQRAAKDELDPVGEPLHPPVAYESAGTPMIVPRVDTPAFSGDEWTGFAVLEPNAAGTRFDLVGWRSIDEDLEFDRVQATAVLLSRPLPWEFPRLLKDVIRELEEQGYARQRLFRIMRLAAVLQPDGTPAYVVLGTPMRRIEERRVQHLTVWRIPTELADVLRLSLPSESDSELMAELREEVVGIFDRWANVAPVEWCRVREDRPEATRRRDTGSPMQWWSGKTVELWGCGALGGRLAEHLVRAGVGRLVLRDYSSVAPGVLVRQNFEYDDVGAGKAKALAARLLRIRPSLDVSVDTKDVLADGSLGKEWAADMDVLIDATASAGVSKRLERLRRTHRNERTAIVACVVGHHAINGMIVTSPPGATGGPADTIRKAKLLASAKLRLRDFAEEFWPVPPRTDLFEPEPGCSNPTFTGSDAELGALASTMLLAATQHLVGCRDGAGVTFVELPGLSEERPGRTESVEFTNDTVLPDQINGYEVRFAAAAIAEIRAWSNRAERLTDGSETGGLLFGERDDAIGVLWVSHVLGPPPDSRASAAGFVCGRAGVDDAASMFRERSRYSSLPVGLWHTHPDSDPRPSPTDNDGMEQVVHDRGRPLPRQLLLIVGGSGAQRTVAAYVYDRDRGTTLRARPRTDPLPGVNKPTHRIGLALSGGGFRAVAFHLGALRALHDRGVLDHVEVVSAVSGGSLIASLWAYNEEPFDAFDDRVVELLRRGLTADIAMAALLGRRAPQAAGTMLIAGSGKLAASTAALGRRAATRLRHHRRARGLEPPFRRWVSRTTAFADVLRDRLFGDLAVNAPRRPVEVVINACELRSGTAFRFGSKESGSSRYGKLVDNRFPLATAVAASAAYPVLLPALDLVCEFESWRGEVGRERVLLTDGGVYDNLGTTCLEPGRSSRHSTNVYPVDYIVSCDAGQGVLDDDSWPLWWPSRMKRSFESLYRKVQDAEKANLHDHALVGSIKGFVMPFLGMSDRNLPLRPRDLVERSEVVHYPTNFSAMTPRDLGLLTKRGEQLTRIIIDHHCPEIS
jgi:predicted acylesterase/phospholipase RssA